MNSVFSFNKYKKNIFFHFWLLVSAGKIIGLPESGGPPGSYAYVNNGTNWPT